MRSESPEKKCLCRRTVLFLWGIQSPQTGTLPTVREETRGLLGKGKDQLTSRGKCADTGTHSSGPWVQQAPRTAPGQPRSAHFHLVPPYIPPPEVPSSLGLLLQALEPLSFLVRECAQRCARAVCRLSGSRSQILGLRRSRALRDHAVR